LYEQLVLPVIDFMCKLRIGHLEWDEYIKKVAWRRLYQKKSGRHWYELRT
jgi:hypothetical protein